MSAEHRKAVFDLMVKKGYPEDFARMVSEQMGTEYTSERMCRYIDRAGLLPAEEIADEMLSILNERDRLIKKHVAQSAQEKLNDIYRNGRE